MSVNLRALEASKALYARATERSLIPALLAVDTTARRRYPRQRSNRDRFVRFLRDNLRVITAVWLGRPADRCSIAASLPGAADAAAGTSLEDLLYHVVRTDIIREKNLMPGLVSVARGIEGVRLAGEHAGALCFSHRLVEGCLAAAVLAPENAQARTPEPAPLYLRSRRYWINRMWGRYEYFCREVLKVEAPDADAAIEIVLTPAALPAPARRN